MDFADFARILRILRDFLDFQFRNENKNKRMHAHVAEEFFFESADKSPYKTGRSQGEAYFKRIFLVEVRHSKQPNLLSRALCASFCSIF